MKRILKYSTLYWDIFPHTALIEINIYSLKGPMSTIKIALIQMLCEKGTIDRNLASIYTYLQAGRSQGVDIICFPEMSITGYINPTRCPEAVLHLNGPEVARFVAMTKDIPVTAIAGLAEANPQGKPFITQIVAHEGRLLGVYRKKTIADDEVAWFAAGSTVTVLYQPILVL